MTILVLGSNGYVGSILCGTLLSNGYKVKAVDNFYKGTSDSLIPYCADPNFEFEFGDVTSLSDMERVVKGVDVIVLLASIVGEPSARKYPALSHLVTVQGAKNVIKAKPKGVPLYYASTGSVYGKIEDLCTEDSPTNPKSIYGLDKLAAERLVLDAENTFAYRFATGFGLSNCLRVNLLINDLTYKAYADKSLVIFQPDFKRSFIHVSEMALSFLYGIQRLGPQSNHRLFNVGCEANNVSKREVAELIKSKTGCLIVYENLFEDPDQRSYAVSFQRWRDEIGWEPTRSIESGVDEILKVAPLLQMKTRYE